MQAEYNGVKKSMLALLCSLHPRPLARFLYAGVINSEASPKNDLGRSSTKFFWLPTISFTRGVRVRRAGARSVGCRSEAPRRAEGTAVQDPPGADAGADGGG